MPVPKGRRASCVGGDRQGICTVVLMSLSRRPMMNLHKVPLHATILMIKEKICERLKDVGRSLPADTIILYEGESRDPKKELDDEKALSYYNFLGLSRFTVTIVRRTRVDLCICLLKKEKKCLCLTTQKPQREEFTVTVPFAFNASQLEHYIAECLNCGVDRRAVVLYWDDAFRDAFPREATLRQLGVQKNTTLYALMPAAFSHDRLKIIELPVRKLEPEAAGAASAAAAAETGEPAEGGTAVAAAAAAAAPEDLALTDAVETTGVVKTPQQLAFEQRANPAGRMNREDAGNYARMLGYSPSKKEIAALPDAIDFKDFQSFLNVTMHPEDSDGRSMKDFFSSFDTEVTGDLTKKQVENVLQMWGDEPLSQEEAEEFSRLLFTSGETSIPIRALVDFVQEGSA